MKRCLRFAMLYACRVACIVAMLCFTALCALPLRSLASGGGPGTGRWLRIEGNPTW